LIAASPVEVYDGHSTSGAQMRLSSYHGVYVLRLQEEVSAEEEKADAEGEQSVAPETEADAEEDPAEEVCPFSFLVVSYFPCLIEQSY